MAWNFFAGTVAPGESVRWAFWWGDRRHEYKGIQVVQAKPVREGGIIVIDGAPDLRVSDQSLKLEEDGGYTYFVTVTNISGSAWFQYRIVGQRVD
jgi:hypothetical protein